MTEHVQQLLNNYNSQVQEILIEYRRLRQIETKYKTMCHDRNEAIDKLQELKKNLEGIEHIMPENVETVAIIKGIVLELVDLFLREHSPCDNNY